MRAIALYCVLLASNSIPASAIPISIAIGEQPPLFSSAGGIVDRLVVEALSSEGYEVTLDWLPIGRMLALLQQDALAIYISPSNTPGQQNPHVDLLEAKGVFFYKKSRFPALDAKTLDNLAGKVVATVVNSPLRSAFERAGILVDEGPMETLFAKLDAERVDFVATADVGGILSIARQFPGRESEFALTDLSYSRIQAGLFIKDRPELRPVLDAMRRGFASMKSDGRLALMLRDFFGPANWRRVEILD